jgi:diphosphomevalonate decarboxylase
LALAASKAAGLDLSKKELSRLARLGSGSACRSVPAGFVEWLKGENDESSYAISIASPEHWELVDCIAVVSEEHKPTGSSEGHQLADTSPLQERRIAGTEKRLEQCREAILRRDFEELAMVTELDSNLMHAVMQTSTPALLYWLPATVEIIHSIVQWRAEGTPVFYTIDAGPNVHVFTLPGSASKITGQLEKIPGVIKVIEAHPGDKARLMD